MSEPKSYVAKRGYAGIRRRLLFLLLLLAMTPLLALGLFCLIYLFYILMAYTSLKRNVLPQE